MSSKIIDFNADAAALAPFASKAGLRVRGVDGEGAGNEHHLYWDTHQCRFYRRSDSGDFIRATESGVRRFLKTKGLTDPRSKDGELTEVDVVLEEVERKWWVEYAGPIAGRQAGWYFEGGQRVLVTTSPRLIAPQKGEWESLASFLEELLGDDQKEWLLGWLHWALTALYANRYRAGQVLVICGPRGSGKTLLASLMTELLGGKSASPLAYLTGKTDFNGEMAGAVHLLIDDDFADADPRVRRQFGASLRGYVASRSQRLHPKGKQALTMNPLWRVSLLLNDDPSSLTVLPVLEESIADKITMMKARVATLPADDDDPDREEKIWGTFYEELPALIYYLLHEYQVREDWRDPRFGIKAYHNHEVLELLEAPAETQLLGLIDLFFTQICESLVDEHVPAPPYFEGPSRLVERTLVNVEPTAKRLFWSANQCGLLLHKLQQQLPARIASRTVSGQTMWKILPADD